ncbi:hypothetical protein L831_1623 [Mycobacteroides abscessus MAB_082312_2272]|nr:hypothetical protein L831_1623 [Mycobacteroides abscessus MAB_082312_2272]
MVVDAPILDEAVTRATRQVSESTSNVPSMTFFRAAVGYVHVPAVIGVSFR